MSDLNETNKPRKVIAMSLFAGYDHGSDKRHDVYFGGAALNANMVWPGWKLIIYHDDTVPTNLLQYLSTFDTVILRVKPRHELLNGAFWRFEAINEFEIVAVRDIDSILLKEDMRITEKWIESGKKVLLMNWYRKSTPLTMNAGLFNWRDGGFPAIDYSIIKKGWYGDTEWLRQNAVPIFINDHDVFTDIIFETKPMFFKAIEPREFGL